MKINFEDITVNSPTVKNKAIVVSSDSEHWEGLYVNGELKDEGHNLNEGEERIIFFVKLAKEYNFDLNELKFATLGDEDDELLMNAGRLPDTLDGFVNNYEEEN